MVDKIAVATKKGWTVLENGDQAVVKTNIKHFPEPGMRFTAEEYPYRSIFQGHLGCWLHWEDHVEWKKIPEAIRIGPFKTKKPKVIAIFHKQPLTPAAAGGETEAPPTNRDAVPPSAAPERERKDRWEIRGDRVCRVVEIPRTHSCTPTSEPEPCPVNEEVLTERRLTIVHEVDGGRRSVVDTWRSTPEGEVSEENVIPKMSEKVWTGEIIFEMTQEEKDKRGLHRTMDLEED